MLHYLTTKLHYLSSSYKRRLYAAHLGSGWNINFLISAQPVNSEVSARGWVLVSVLVGFMQAQWRWGYLYLSTYFIILCVLSIAGIMEGPNQSESFGTGETLAKESS